MCVYFHIFLLCILLCVCACCLRVYIRVFVHLLREWPADRFYYLHVNVSSTEFTAAIHHQRFSGQANAGLALHAAKLKTTLHTSGLVSGQMVSQIMSAVEHRAEKVYRMNDGGGHSCSSIKKSAVDSVIEKNSWVHGG